MTFMDVIYEEKEKFQRRDLTPYRAVFDGLKPGVQATVTVPTGELKTEGSHKGKGALALSHEQGFRDVARERGVGLQVSHNIMGDKTRLNLMTQKRREFPPEVLAQRTEALRKSRIKRAIEKKIADGMTKDEAMKAVQAEETARAKAKATAGK